ncbi:MAG: acetoacetate decarboxylase, partial [Gammaproteobacteria bacterium]
MTDDEVKKQAFAMPLTSPAYPRGPYRFVDREYFIPTYRSAPSLLEKILPAPLKLHEPLVKFEFMKMPNSTGFGDYCEAGQVIPVLFEGEVGGYQHAMYLNDHAPIAGGLELWGFPKKLGCPELDVHKACRYLVIDFGTSKSPKSTRLRDSH